MKPTFLSCMLLAILFQRVTTMTGRCFGSYENFFLLMWPYITCNLTTLFSYRVIRGAEFFFSSPHFLGKFYKNTDFVPLNRGNGTHLSLARTVGTTSHNQKWLKKCSIGALNQINPNRFRLKRLIPIEHDLYFILCLFLFNVNNTRERPLFVGKNSFTVNKL